MKRLKNIPWFQKQGEEGNWLSSVVEIKILDDNDKVAEVIFTSILTVIPKDSAP